MSEGQRQLQLLLRKQLDTSSTFETYSVCTYKCTTVVVKLRGNYLDFGKGLRFCIGHASPGHSPENRPMDDIVANDF